MHIYPEIEEGYGTKVQILENGTMDFRVLATDNEYFAVPIQEELVFRTEGDIGEISEEGVFTAAAGAHTGQIIVETASGHVRQSFDVSVVDSLTKITADRSILSVAPGGSTELKFTAESHGTVVILTASALEFELSDEKLGTIGADGVFYAADTQGTGTLTIRYKDYSFDLPIEVGRLPLLLNDFEVPLAESNWQKRYVNTQNGGSGTMSINYDERYVKSGDGSLRIDYDFATKPVTGTISIEVGPLPEYQEIPGQPSAIGMWVYGDGNGGWLRVQLAGGKHVGDTYVNWKGWKYIETPIPVDAPFPYKLQWGVRLLATPALDVNHKRGTIYVDQLRAIYDFKNDDLTAPVLVGEDTLTPAPGAINQNNQALISMTVKDPIVEGEPYTGIDTGRSRLWINGVLQDNIQHDVHQDGSVTVSYMPSALNLLRSGKNHVRYRVEDNAGNKLFHDWEFTVEGYNVNLYEVKPSADKAAAGSTFTYEVHAADYKDFEHFDFLLRYNPLYVNLAKWSTDSRVEVLSSELDPEQGTIRLELQGMDKISVDEEQPLISLDFSVPVSNNGQTGILVDRALVRETGEVQGTNLHLAGYDVEVEIPYTLTYDGVTHNRPTTLYVRNSDSELVENMTIHYVVEGEAFVIEGVTSSEGSLETDVLTRYPVGTRITLTAYDPNGGISNTTELEVQASLGTNTPQKIAITTGQDPTTQVGFAWESSLDVTTGEVRIASTPNMENYQVYPASASETPFKFNNQTMLANMWGAHVEDLVPGTTYYYQVGTGEIFSEVKAFTTAKAGLRATFAVYGDLQGKFEEFPHTRAQLENLYPNPDINLIAGDISDSGDQYSNWSLIDTHVGESFGTRIWANAIGNHDVAMDAQIFTSYFKGPNNGTYSTPRNYWFTLGNATVYVMDTESTTYDLDYSGQLAKMAEVFAQSDKDFNVVLMHRAPYPMNYNETHIRALVPDLEAMGVDLVLSGHDHIYSRTQMLNDQKSTDGIQYVVTGTSTGGKYYDAVTGRYWEDVVYDENNKVFNVFETTEDTLSFKAFAIEGSLVREIDSFSIVADKALSAQYDERYVAGPAQFLPGETLEYVINYPDDHVLESVSVNGVVVDLEADGRTLILEHVEEDIEIILGLRQKSEAELLAFVLDEMMENLGLIEEVQVNEENIALLEANLQNYDGAGEEVLALLTPETKAKAEALRILVEEYWAALETEPTVTNTCATNAQQVRHGRPCLAPSF